MPIQGVLEITEELVPRLLPLLPYLVKGIKLSGQELVKKIGEIGGEKVWNTINTIWGKLRPKIENNEIIKSEIGVIANSIYSDTNAPVALQTSLTKILLEDEILKKELEKIIERSKREGLDISSYIEVSRVFGELIGIEIGQIKKLENNIASYLKLETVEKGAKVIGLKTDSLGD